MLSAEQLQARRALAQRVHKACLDAALAAYERAGIAGLCGDGAWECAVGAVRDLDVEALLESSCDPD